jgi:hypothetical protein
MGAISVFGPGSNVTGSSRSGARLTAGVWLDEDQDWGLEAGYFFLGSLGRKFNLAGDGSPGSQVIGRPFFNPLTMAEDAEVVAFPGVLAGHVGVSTSSSLQGAEANVLCNLSCSCNHHLDALAGFRFLDLGERLTVTEHLSALPGVPVTGATQFDILDAFRTSNQFYGGQVGVRSEHSWGALYTSLSARVAAGVIAQSVDISGATRSSAPSGVVAIQPGGLLALPTNMGHFSRNQFAVLPEGSLVVGYQVTGSLRAWVGCTFLYCTNVVRPGDQIDRIVNPTFLPTGTGAGLPPARPGFSFQTSDFWAGGLSLGLEYRF